MINWKFVIKKKHHRKIFIKIAVIFFFLLIIFNQLFFLTLASITDHSSNELKADYTTTKITDMILGKAFTLNELNNVIGKVVTFDAQNNGYFVGYLATNYWQESSLILGKLDDNGNQLWTIQWAILDHNEPQDIVYDKETNGLYVIGTTMNTSSFYKETFIACFNPDDGSELWNTTFSEENYSVIPNSIAITDEQIFVTGVRTPFWYLDTRHNIFLLCFQKSNGALNWSKTFSTSLYNTQPSLTVNVEDSELILVYNQRSDFDSVPFYRYFIQKLDLLGNVIFEVPEIESEYVKINDIMLHNESGSLIVVGDFWESSNHNHKTSIIRRFDSTLNQTFQLVIGESNENEVILNIVCDSMDNLIFTGYADSDLKSTRVAFIGKYTWSGDKVWLNKVEMFFTSTFNDVAIDNADNLLLTGEAQYNIDLFFRRLFVGYTKDSDNDLLSDFFELELGTDPLNPDTDGDGFSDGQEYLVGTDPLNACNNPDTRRFWNYFGFVLAFIVISVFIIINLFVYLTSDKSNENDQSPIIKLFSKINLRKKKENSNQQNKKEVS